MSHLVLFFQFVYVIKILQIDKSIRHRKIKCFEKIYNKKKTQSFSVSLIAFVYFLTVENRSLYFCFFLYNFIIE